MATRVSSRDPNKPVAFLASGVDQVEAYGADFGPSGQVGAVETRLFAAITTLLYVLFLLVALVSCVLIWLRYNAVFPSHSYFMCFSKVFLKF